MPYDREMNTEELIQEALKKLKSLKHNPGESREWSLKEIAKVLELCGAVEKTPNRYCQRDLEVMCPKCQAPPGAECRTQPKTGAWIPAPHDERRNLWQNAFNEHGD